MIVAPGAHNRMANGILGLLCKRHYLGCMEIARQLQPAYSLKHYITAVDAPDREGMANENKVKRVLNELWVSLHGTTFMNTSHSLVILEIMNLFMFMCRISTDARRE